MNYKKTFSFLKKLPNKLNSFFFKKSKKKPVIFNKAKNIKNFDPVTNMDRAFEKFIRGEINRKFPEDSIIGEEYKKKVSKNDYMWSIDPIDGTRAFVIGVPTWSNLISLSFKNQSKIGLANFPMLKKFYLNDRDNSYLYEGKKKIKLRSSKNTNLKKVKIIGNFHGSISYEKQKKIINKLGSSLRLASFDALSYCLLSEGLVDAVIEANLKTYDILPLIPILENSGAIVTKWNNKSAQLGGNILATSNVKLHNKMINILKPFEKK